MAKLTDRQRDARITFAMIKLHLNAADVQIRKLRDELRDEDPAITAQAFSFARGKLQDLFDKYRSVS